MDKTLIAPCGMNCAVCLGYLRDKNKCPGCNTDSPKKRISCQKCTIKNCEVIKNNKSKLCYECEKFPCARLKRLDKRYRANYSMSMIENLEQIRDFGIEIFIKNEKEKRTCEKCGGAICVHRGYCIKCG